MRRRRGTDAERSRVVLLVALGVDNLGTGLFLPLGLVFATRVVGLRVDIAGAVVATAALLGFAVPPVAGRHSHRFGPRRVVVLSQLVQAAVFVMVADVGTDTAKERPFARVAMVRSAAFGLGNLTAAVTLAVGGTESLPWLVATDAVTYVVAAGLLAWYVETPPVDHGTPAGARSRC